MMVLLGEFPALSVNNFPNYTIALTFTTFSQSVQGRVQKTPLKSI